jgi:hypothetical protein
MGRQGRRGAQVNGDYRGTDAPRPEPERATETAARLYKLSKQTKQWEVKELEQLISAARHSYLAYTQLYDELTRAAAISQAAH